MNNYIELDLGGKKRGAKLGLLILKKTCEAKKIMPDELFKMLEGNNALFTIPELLFQSLKFNAEKKKEAFDYTVDDVFEWIDESGGVQSTVFQDYVEALMASLGVDLGKETPQKKVATKK